MAHEELLSQDEIDTLLQGVESEHETQEGTGASPRVNGTPAAAAPAPKAVAASDPAPAETGGGRPYNAALMERIVRTRMPGLEIINDRFSRLFRQGLFNFLQRLAEVSVHPFKVLKYSEFTSELPSPANLNLVHMRPLRGTALFVFDEDLVFFLVDTLFGGEGHFHKRQEKRDFTYTEQRIIGKLLDMVFEHYASAWHSVESLQLESIRSETHWRFANITTPDDMVIVSRFSIQIGSSQGDMTICMPYSMIEPVRGELSSPIQDEDLEIDHRRQELLSQQVQEAEVELTVELAQIQSTFAQVLNLRAGDILPVKISDTVTAKIDGLEVMECQYGTFNGQYALRVHKSILASGMKNEGEYE